MSTTTASAPLPYCTVVSTDQLAVGDVVRSHGMRVRLDSLRTYDDRGSRVFAFDGTILNVDEVDEAGFVPRGFRVRRNVTPSPASPDWTFDSWTIQGNDLATWTVERPNDCPICGRPVDAPYRLIRDGKVAEGCCADAHTVVDSWSLAYRIESLAIAVERRRNPMLLREAVRAAAALAVELEGVDRARDARNIGSRLAYAASVAATPGGARSTKGGFAGLLRYLAGELRELPVDRVQRTA